MPCGHVASAKLTPKTQTKENASGPKSRGVPNSKKGRRTAPFETSQLADAFVPHGTDDDRLQIVCVPSVFAWVHDQGYNVASASFEAFAFEDAIMAISSALASVAGAAP